MVDKEKRSIASLGLEIKRGVVKADEKSAPVIDAPGYDKEIGERFMEAIVGGRHYQEAQIIPFRRPSDDDLT